ncbi:glycoside hydrolase family 76 protein [Limibacterium fermenti]|mgnify:FL=1|uniref:glycoside hydrolase family 76 protein n=1 Tax=Limibacterium fermenti TaxID=3229863 RepID=UPI00268A62B5
MMNSKSFFILSFLFLTVNCSGKEVLEETTGRPIELKEFSSQDAITAIDAFNTYFFDVNKQLYFHTSDKKGVAAIWTQAIYWDMLMNAYKKTNDQQYLALVHNFYEGCYNYYDKYNWDNGVVWFIYDDIMWWVISFARAYELTGEQKFLTYSQTGFERVWSGSKVVGDNGSYDVERGGMYWAWDQQNPIGTPAKTMGKMACINYPTVIAAMTLYNITQNEDYLNKAKEIYDWSRNNLFDKKTGAVADSRHGEGTPNWKTHVYNQGTCIGAAVMLYKQTKEEKFLNDAILAADYTKNKMSDSKGVLPFETGIEQGIYTAIFAQYIIRLIEDGGQTQYLDWMRYNANKAWANRDSRNLTYKNFNTACPTGVLEVYDVSGAPAIMQVIPPKTK